MREIKPYKVGDCFTAETYGKLAEYVVASVYPEYGMTNYGLYYVSLDEDVVTDIRQCNMLDSPSLSAAIKKDVVNLHWLTFDEVADMIIDMGDTAKVVGYATQMKGTDETRHLFIKNNERIIQISVAQSLRVRLDSMIGHVFAKNISKEEFQRIVEDKALGFVPMNMGIFPARLDKWWLFYYLDIPEPDCDVEVHGLIINDNIMLVDHDHFFTAQQKMIGLFWLLNT